MCNNLDFILASVLDDERPYLSVSVLGREILGLLDSGASRTIVGSLGISFLHKLGLEIDTKSDVTSCKVANGEHCSVSGVIRVPFRLRDRVRVIEVLAVQSLPLNLILGTDFWRKMGIVPDLRHGEWSFSKVPQVAVIKETDDLGEEQKTILSGLIEDELPASNGKIGCTTLVEHQIRVKSDVEPIKQRHYPLSPALQTAVNKELDEMLAHGIVEPSNSPWSSPIVLVRKKDGNYRFCVDFRKVNSVTTRDASPLPFVTNTLDKLRDACYLSSLDVKSAYWQVPVTEESRPITAFVVPGRGLFQFKRMPFGLHNAPATWQRLIDRVLGVDLEPYVFVYLDDIVVVTHSFDKHIEVLREVFRRLRAAGLTLGRDKCQLCRSELRYLGYVVDREGLRVDPDKVRSILDYPAPKTVTEVRRFMDMASWYRRFIPNFSTVAAPINRLIRKGCKFEWSEEAESAFGKIKDFLISALVLRCPDFSLSFTIQADASDYGLGAVLSQIHPDGEHVVAYVSRSLDHRERKFSVTEKECLAVLFGISKFRPYVEGSRFSVITDHFSLKWLHSLKDPTGRLARWSVKLQQYNFEVIHRKGREHVVPDALSRAVPVVGSLEPEGADKWYLKMLKEVSDFPLDFPLWHVEDRKLFRRVRNEYPELAGEVYSWKPVVPKSQRVALLKRFHDDQLAGHTGVRITYHRLCENYFWPGMRKDVAAYVRKCHVCLTSKPQQNRPAGLMCGREVSRPWEVICVDLVGPLPKSRHGKLYILSVLDYFSKFVLLLPLRTAKSAQIAKLLEERVFCMFGVPHKIICDNGKQFVGRELKTLTDTYHTKLSFTPLYHPQANAVERVHRSMNAMLRSYLREKKDHRDWEDILPKVACALRTAKHESTGQSPYFINFGRHICLDGSGANQPIDDSEPVEDRVKGFARLYEDVRQKLQAAMLRTQKQYNLRRRDVQFDLGQKVWRRNMALSKGGDYVTSKLLPKYIGPFVVSKRLNPWTYELATGLGRHAGMWNAKDLKADPAEEEPD